MVRPNRCVRVLLLGAVMSVACKKVSEPRTGERSAPVLTPAEPPLAESVADALPEAPPVPIESKDGVWFATHEQVARAAGAVLGR